MSSYDWEKEHEIKIKIERLLQKGVTSQNEINTINILAEQLNKLPRLEDINKHYFVYHNKIYEIYTVELNKFARVFLNAKYKTIVFDGVEHFGVFFSKGYYSYHNGEKDLKDLYRYIIKNIKKILSGKDDVFSDNCTCFN